LFLNKLPANTRETFKWKSRRKKNTGYSIWRYSLIHTFKWLKPTTEDVTQGLLVGFMVFNATFNNISVISWRSVLLVEETGVPRKNHRPAASHWQTLSHMLYPLKSYWTQTFKNMGVGDVGILQAGHFLMDPLKEAAWKLDFKFVYLHSKRQPRTNV
jgi:hypothetical protein